MKYEEVSSNSAIVKHIKCSKHPHRALTHTVTTAWWIYECLLWQRE